MNSSNNALKKLTQLGFYLLKEFHCRGEAHMIYVAQQNFNPQLRKGCKSSLKIMPSLIILNVNYSEVQTETKNLFHTKKLDILIGPSE